MKLRQFFTLDTLFLNWFGKIASAAVYMNPSIRLSPNSHVLIVHPVICSLETTFPSCVETIQEVNRDV